MTEEPPDEPLEPQLGELTFEEMASLGFARTLTEKALKVAKRHHAN